jgi:hypothetical protein
MTCVALALQQFCDFFIFLTHAFVLTDQSFFYPAFAGSPLGDPSKTLQYLCAAGDYTLET